MNSVYTPVHSYTLHTHPCYALLHITIHITGKYTVFGQVIDGLDVLSQLEKIPTDSKDRPQQEVRIQRVTIHANPLA